MSLIYSKYEKKILSELVFLEKKIKKLKNIHPQEESRFVEYISECKQVVKTVSMCRKNPKNFPPYNKGGK